MVKPAPPGLVPTFKGDATQGTDNAVNEPHAPENNCIRGFAAARLAPTVLSVIVGNEL